MCQDKSAVCLELGEERWEVDDLPSNNAAEFGAAAFQMSSKR